MSELMKEPCQLVVARTMAHLVGSGEHGHVGLGISLPYRTPMEIERARRILACVNACAGVPTESLEAHIPIGGVKLIIAERARQITVEGWSEEHDDAHDDRSLAQAAGCYVSHYVGTAGVIDRYPSDGIERYVDFPVPMEWPEEWDEDGWKPKDPLRDLVRAGALIAAEIDRLLRVEAKHDRPEP